MIKFREQTKKMHSISDQTSSDLQYFQKEMDKMHLKVDSIYDEVSTLRREKTDLQIEQACINQKLDTILEMLKK